MSWRWRGWPTSLRRSSRSSLKYSFLNSSTALLPAWLPVALGRGIQDGVDDRLVAGAAADVAGDGLRHFLTRRQGIAIEQRLGRHQHARGTEAALGREVLHEGHLQGMQVRPLGEAERGLDRAAGASLGQREAGELGLAVDQHGAHAAGALAAAELG